MITPGASTSSGSAPVAMRAGAQTFVPPHKAARPAIAAIAACLAAHAIRVLPSAMLSIAVESRTPFIGLPKTIPTAPPGYNPHSARPTRSFAQSGLQ
ncbi:hypothetical protein NKI34_29260 [Mesorhizobium sp. M0700]|uniref:hypothetical protein n=1 Tax=Mesorhizobium sp. M0700 TaxID=2956988 RepID=UPI00333A4777